jgi:putative hydrolases of HD superfamily
VINSIIGLAQLSLQFGRTNRVTYHEDGKTLESDTDHTCMLGLIACAFAERVNQTLPARGVSKSIETSQTYSYVNRSPLDIGLIAQFAFVHDLVEALCGDTNTLRISSQGRVSKEEREHAALEELRRRFAALPWIAATIDRYEALDTPEARFVKVVDKVLPKLTHALNGGAALREHDVDLAKLRTVNGSQREQIAATYGADQPEAMRLLYEAHDELVRRLAEAAS